MIIFSSFINIQCNINNYFVYKQYYHRYSLDLQPENCWFNTFVTVTFTHYILLYTSFFLTRFICSRCKWNAWVCDISTDLHELWLWLRYYVNVVSIAAKINSLHLFSIGKSKSTVFTIVTLHSYYDSRMYLRFMKNPRKIYVRGI